MEVTNAYNVFYNVRILVPEDEKYTFSSLSKVIPPTISNDNDYGLMYKECK